MIVGELIRLLQAQDPDAIVLIPHDPGLGGGAEAVSDVVGIPADQFRGGPAAANGAVRLSGFTPSEQGG